jgi:hypothetical protein
MDEADRKRQLVREVNALPGAYALRIEHKWAVGVLDLVIKLPGHPWLWAEGKMVDGNLFAPTKRQFEEGNRIMQTGTPVVLLGWKQRFMFVSKWTDQADVRTCFFGSGQWAPVLMEYLKGARIK